MPGRNRFRLPPVRVNALGRETKGEGEGKEEEEEDGEEDEKERGALSTHRGNPLGLHP